MKLFYITTPLYYVNDQPHIGTTYTTVLADVLKRFHQMLGYKCYLLTGIDEHGQKCFKAAKHIGLNPQEHCENMANVFKSTWSLLDISYNQFFRTTSAFHKEAVTQCLQKLYEDHWIYKASYTGWYCVSEEIFYKNKDLVDGKSPSGKPVIQIQEDNYFFKMSCLQPKLLKYIQEHPDFIRPPHHRNEVLGFLKKPLEDLCISRPHARLSWGIPLPFDKDYTTYVWVDALLNYATARGYPQNQQNEWELSPPVHLIGKDILITHAVYWPCLLMALGLKLPKTIFAHGWLLNSEGNKMSKSEGDVLSPQTLLSQFHRDELRYFLVKHLPLERDALLKPSQMAKQVEEDLSNNLGNLLSRTVKMVQKYLDSQITPPDLAQLETQPDAKELRTKTELASKRAREAVLDLNPSLAVKDIISLLSESNRFIEKTAPWKLVKTQKSKQAKCILSLLSETLILSAILLKPIMPQKMQTLLEVFSVPTQNPAWPDTFHLTKPIKIRPLSKPLFPRHLKD